MLEQGTERATRSPNPLDQTPFEALGGEDRVRALTDAFYDRMGQDPAAAPIRKMHPEDLTESRRSSSSFMRMAWWAGLYVQKHGHPCPPHATHAFAIGESERDQWLGCMAFAMDELEVEESLRAFLDARFAHVADFSATKAAKSITGVTQDRVVFALATQSSIRPSVSSS